MRDALIDDIRLAWRRLRKSPSFTLVAILTLALGIGANTAIFTLLHALIFRDLAVRNPGELVQLSMVMRNGQEIGLSFPAFRQIERDSGDMFSSLIAWTGGMLLPAEASGEPAPANVWMVTGNFHSELGVSPALGRLLSPADANLETVSGASVAVLGLTSGNAVLSAIRPSWVARSVLRVFRSRLLVFHRAAFAASAARPKRTLPCRSPRSS